MILWVWSTSDQPWLPSRWAGNLEHCWYGCFYRGSKQVLELILLTIIDISSVFYIDNVLTCLWCTAVQDVLRYLSRFSFCSATDRFNKYPCNQNSVIPWYLLSECPQEEGGGFGAWSAELSDWFLISLPNI